MSHRKRWRWIFVSFAIVIFISIAVALVSFEKFKKKDHNDDNPENPTQSTDVYATSFSINLPDTIQILLNTKVKFTLGYVNVTPASAIDMLNYEISTKSGGDMHGINFEDNIITANTVGTYTIKFKMPKSSSTNFSKNINIVVYDEVTNGHVYQINNTTIVGKRTDISDLFSILEGKTYNIETDSKIKVSNNIINSINEGESKIKFTFVENYVSYIYDFTLNIKEQPKYEIIVKNITNNTVEIDLDVEPVEHIEFEIIDRDSGDVDQVVDAVSSDEHVVTIVSYTEPLIKIQAVGLGEAIITISYSLDASIKVEIRVVVK